METRKPAPLHALTGLRCFAAINIVFFHFSNPQWFGFLAPVVNAGFISVSYFILLSGFVLAYNYAERARNGQLDRTRFWEARFTRIYPIYLLSLILSLGRVEGRVREPHSPHVLDRRGAYSAVVAGLGSFNLNIYEYTGLDDVGGGIFLRHIPVACEVEEARERMAPHSGKMSAVWVVGLIPGALYMYFHPDGITWPDRWSYGVWLWALKYTPYAHLASFVFGVMLASLDQMIDRANPIRLVAWAVSVSAQFRDSELGPLVPYAIIHDGLLMPLFACIILGLAGRNPLATALSVKPLVFVGEASYCLYLLHFNLWHICTIPACCSGWVLRGSTRG